MVSRLTGLDDELTRLLTSRSCKRRLRSSVVICTMTFDLIWRFRTTIYASLKCKLRTGPRRSHQYGGRCSKISREMFLHELDTQNKFCVFSRNVLEERLLEYPFGRITERCETLWLFLSAYQHDLCRSSPRSRKSSELFQRGSLPHESENLPRLSACSPGVLVRHCETREKSTRCNTCSFS